MPTSVEVLRTRSYTTYFTMKAFGGSYIVYDWPSHVYYVGTSVKDVPGRLRHHLTKEGTLVRHVMADRGVTYEMARDEIRSWTVATTSTPEWLLIEVLRPTYGHRHRQSFYYGLLRDMGMVLLDSPAPRFGAVPQFIKALNLRLRRAVGRPASMPHALG